MATAEIRYVTVAVAGGATQEEAERAVYHRIAEAEAPMRIITNAVRMERAVGGPAATTPLTRQVEDYRRWTQTADHEYFMAQP